MKVYIARQPIFTRNKKIYAYELLFRESMENFFPDIDGNSATSRVLSSTFFSSDIEKITGGKRAFINFTRELIHRKVPLLFPMQTTTVEILETVEPDELVIECCRDLCAGGYQIALDDFVYRNSLDELIELADIIKIDFLSTGIDEIREYVKMLSKKKCELLAEKVETNEQFRMAREMGFSYFQGFFFSKPEVMGETDIPSLKMNLLQIMAEAGSDNFRIDELKRLIERDVGISYKLLRYLNSPFFRRRNEITSIKHAILLLGEKGMKSFLSVIIMSVLSQDKPDELLKASVMRARLCENLGLLQGKNIDPAELFTLGLFSLIDAILDSPMEQIMKKLPLAQEIKAALLEQDNRLSEFLRLTKEYEMGNWEEVFSGASSLGLETSRLPEIYLDALGFADALLETTEA